jgi:hypothetical protein
VSPTLMLILGGAVAGAPAATNNSVPTPTPPRVPAEAPAPACRPQEARNIVVCGQRPQPYRLDPGLMEAGQEAESNSRSASTATPAAQAACATVCGKGLESLDWANVAIVVGETAVRAAKGEDWARVFRPGGPDEYRLYQQAKHRREVEASERAAAEVKRKAEEQERAAHATNADSD